jgi:hypothetical protein
MTKTRDLADLGGGFIQAGTGAVQRTVESKLQDMVSVKDFGAVGNGVADDTAAIQAAINAAAALQVSRFRSGATVYFPNGTYLVSSTITVNTDGIVLNGESYGGVTIEAASPTFDIIKFDNGGTALYHCGVSNLRVLCSGNATAGAAIKCNRLLYGSITNVGVDGHWVGFELDGCNKFYLDRVYSNNTSRSSGFCSYSLYCRATTNACSDVHVSNYQFVVSETYRPNYSVLIEGSDGIYWVNGHQHGGTLVQPTNTGGGTTCASIFWTNIYFDKSPIHHVVLAGTAASYRSFRWTNCTFRDGNRGIYQTSTSNIAELIIDGCRFSTHTNSAISLNETTISGVTITACQFNDNESSSAVIYYAGDTAIISGCTFLDTSTVANVSANCIFLIASSTKILLTNCNFKEHPATTPIQNAGGTSNALSSGLYGYTLKAKGQATIANPNTSATVTHGLAETPSISAIRLTLNNDATGVTRFYVSNVTSTTFDINTNAAPTTSAVIGWQIDSTL